MFVVFSELKNNEKCITSIICGYVDRFLAQRDINAAIAEFDSLDYWVKANCLDTKEDCTKIFKKITDIYKKLGWSSSNAPGSSNFNKVNFRIDTMPVKE